MDKIKLLIVEDDTAIASALSIKFTNEGFNVLVAKDGKEGLAIAISEKPAMILLDIVMPVMDGITMLNLLRATEWGKMANVILLTNLMEADKMSEAMENNANVYLIKSDWKIDDLVKEVKKRM
ncbi:response regulator [bacterium]|nr:response regulator [bacterium]